MRGLYSCGGFAREFKWQRAPMEAKVNQGSFSCEVFSAMATDMGSSLWLFTAVPMGVTAEKPWCRRRTAVVLDMPEEAAVHEASVVGCGAQGCRGRLRGSRRQGGYGARGARGWLWCSRRQRSDAGIKNFDWVSELAEVKIKGGRDNKRVRFHENNCIKEISALFNTTHVIPKTGNNTDACLYSPCNKLEYFPGQSTQAPAWLCESLQTPRPH